ncbi:MAG: superinfection exclusion B family protein [Nitrospirae bacterium]|nr:superinfection exclusion B family protein [Magnetococcales bacterium]
MEEKFHIVSSKFPIYRYPKIGRSPQEMRHGLVCVGTNADNLDYGSTKKTDKVSPDSQVMERGRLMPEWLTKLSSVKELVFQPRILGGIWFFGVLLIVLPTSLYGDETISNLILTYRGWIIFITMGTFSVWMSSVLPTIIATKIKKYKSRKKLKERKQIALDFLATLAYEERMLISFCIDNNQQTITMPYVSPVASGLKSKGLLNAPMDGHLLSHSFTIPHFVWKHIVENKIDLASDDRQKDRDFEKVRNRIIDGMRVC